MISWERIVHVTQQKEGKVNMKEYRLKCPVLFNGYFVFGRGRKFRWEATKLFDKGLTL